MWNIFCSSFSFLYTRLTIFHYKKKVFSKRITGDVLSANATSLLWTCVRSVNWVTRSSHVCVRTCEITSERFHYFLLQITIRLNKWSSKWLKKKLKIVVLLGTTELAADALKITNHSINFECWNIGKMHSIYSPVYTKMPNIFYESTRAHALRMAALHRVPSHSECSMLLILYCLRVFAESGLDSRDSENRFRRSCCKFRANQINWYASNT